MRRFQPRPSLPKSPRSLFVWRSPITPTRGPYHCWRSLCRILSSTGNCSSNFHLDLKMKNAGQAPSEAWRVGRQTALLTGSAIVSGGTRSDTDQSCWDYPGPYPMSFASSPKRTFEPSQSTQPMSAFGCKADITQTSDGHPHALPDIEYLLNMKTMRVAK